MSVSLEDLHYYNSSEFLSNSEAIPNPHHYITVRGAREHNLKNVSLVIPKNKLVVFSGLSGSGKSSLVFDTIYAEGQRRYVESLSSYARQFLGLKEKPEVNSIDGLSPAISIDQKSTSQNPRSTVGTITEIYDYMRLLWARIGTKQTRDSDEEVLVESVSKLVDLLLQTQRVVVLLAPLVQDKKGWHKQHFLEAKKNGFKRVRVNGQIWLIDDALNLELNKQQKHSIEIVVDRLETNTENRLRLLDSVETALKFGNQKLWVLEYEGETETLSKFTTDTNSSIQLEPRMFSFNSPHGACPHCSGLGFITEIDPALVVPNENLSIMEGCIKPISRMSISGGWLTKVFESLAQKYHFSLHEPWYKLSDQAKQILLYGDGNFEGVINTLYRRYKETTSEASRRDIESYMNKRVCPVCQGTRLKAESLNVLVAGYNIAQVSNLSINQALDFFEKLQQPSTTTLTSQQQQIARLILKEIVTRLKFLVNVGLSYLTLARSADTLSGGEAQRIRLATQIGSGLTGVLYILDEPSIGLHQVDNERLLNTLKGLRDLGNTVLVVEHDEETIRSADFVVDVGPQAGKWGGEIVAVGTPEEIAKNPNSPTGRFLSGQESIPVPSQRRPVEPYVDDPQFLKANPNYTRYLSILGAAENNLKNLDVHIPLKKLVCITGVSGSGKSTLINDILANHLMNYFYDSRLPTGKFKTIQGLNYIDKAVIIDQTPIGKTPRSNPATYTGLFAPIRELFAELPEAKARGYTQSRFSFNIPGGRCETCEGNGFIRVEMNFLPDVYVVCEDCQGKRYNRETLEILYKGKSIADVLDMSVTEALEFFQNHKLIQRKLETLESVGLGYIHLGQAATTLSGGEAQRVKLATELSKVGTGNTLYILDEPTTGLHALDVKLLLQVLQKLVDKGNTVVVIEHNLDVIKHADWIIDLGPEGGEQGGQIVATGTPEEVAQNEHSYTGQFLKKILTTN